MPLKFDAVSEMLAVTKQHLHQLNRFEPDQEASQGAEFYDQFARTPTAESSENPSEKDEKDGRKDPVVLSSIERPIELDKEAIQSSDDPASVFDEPTRDLAIVTPQATASVPIDLQPPIPISSKQSHQKAAPGRIDGSARREAASKPEDRVEDNARSRTASLSPSKEPLVPSKEPLVPSKGPGIARKERTETPIQTRLPAAVQKREEQSTTRPEQTRLGPDPSTRTSKEPDPGFSDPEMASAKNAEVPRTKRRSDRSSSRSRPSNDDWRESTDRSQLPDKPNESRSGVTRFATLRESSAAQATDSTLQSDTAIRSAQAVPPSSGPAIESTSGVPVSTPAAKSLSNTSRLLPTGPQIASSEAMTRGAVSATPTANVASHAENTRPMNEGQGATGTRLSQYQENKLVQRVLRGMEQLANGGGQVRMRLHPPELGSLQMSLRIEGTTVFAEMQVETTSARDTLMKNLPILKDRLAEQGMQIQQFDVRADGNFDGGNFNASSRNGYSGSDSSSDRQSSRYVAELRNRLPDTSSATAADLVRRWTRTHGMLDFEA